MRGQAALRAALGLLVLGGSAIPMWSQAQGVRQTVAIRAGRLFDPKSGANLIEQVVLIDGDRITDVGPSNRVRVPAGARVINLSQATVLPGLIDGHVHLTDATGGLQHQMMVGLNSATRCFHAGFPTLVAMASPGGG